MSSLPEDTKQKIREKIKEDYASGKRVNAYKKLQKEFAESKEKIDKLELFKTNITNLFSRHDDIIQKAITKDSAIGELCRDFVAQMTQQ